MQTANGIRSRFRRIVAAVATAVACAIWAPNRLVAGIVATSGHIKVVEPPSDARTGRFEHDQFIHVFPEKTDFETTTVLRVDVSRPGEVIKVRKIEAKKKPGKKKKGKRKNRNRPARTKAVPNLSERTIPIAASINSYFLHFDTVTDGSTRKTLSGKISFDEEIVGIIIDADQLVATNATCGATNTLYSTGKQQGVEVKKGNSIVLSEDMRSLTVKLIVTNRSDNIRIITKAKSDHPTKSHKKKKPKDRKPEQKPEDADASPTHAAVASPTAIDRRQID